MSGTGLQVGTRCRAERRICDIQVRNRLDFGQYNYPEFRLDPFFQDQTPPSDDVVAIAAGTAVTEALADFRRDHDSCQW